MNMWGLFRSVDGSCHVLPTDEYGFAINDHQCDMHCWCRPAVDDEEPSLLIHFDTPPPLH